MSKTIKNTRRAILAAFVIVFALGALRATAGYPWEWGHTIHIPALGTMLPGEGSNNGNGAIGGGNNPSPSATPTVDARLAQAASTQGGQAAIQKGLKATSVIPSNAELAQFLNTQTNSSDTYIVFSLPGQPAVDSPTSGYVPDEVVGLNSGTIVALNQAFADGRGTLCYNNTNVANITGVWLPLNVWLRGKSLGASYRAGHADVDLIPDGSNNDLTCYVYNTSG